MLKDASFSLLNVTLAERIKTARERAGMSKSDLARAVQVSPSAVLQWESGETKTVEGENLVKIAIATSVDPIWLGTGKGEMQTKPLTAAEVASPTTYRVQTAQGGAVVVPMFDAVASMGPGVMTPEHDTVIGGMQLSDAWVSRNLKGISGLSNLAVISAIGDSMAPTFTDGDILLVDRGVFELKLDAVYVLCKGNELFIKRVHRRLGGGVVIKSDNPLHGQEEVPDPESVGLRVLGRVVWAWNGKRL
jgi:phage repressor protein C with HTH and peptisase S24 domain